MHKMFRIKAYEEAHGPHFDEKHARKAVNKMLNEDGSRGPHWSIEETTQLANQYGINFNSHKFNKYDWFVALNMIYSDFYKVIVMITNSVNTKHFIEFAKAWLCDKDIDEGKMWYYYTYIMCEEIREEEMEKYEEECEEEDDDEDSGNYRMRRGNYRMRSGRSRMSGRRSVNGLYRHSDFEDDYSSNYDSYQDYPDYSHSKSTRYIRY